MEKEELIIEISVESRKAIANVASTSDALNSLAAGGAVSIGKLNEAFKALNTSRAGQTSTQEIGKLNLALKEVQTTALNLKQVGLSSTLTPVDESARRARIAVYGLNQVVRDAPFGFIAISNNLPILLDQFQSLVKETGSVKNAFRSFASGLLGAGGISIAISAVISLITSAVQKYGSLDNAIKSILGTLTAAEETQIKYNKAFLESADATFKAKIKLEDLTKAINLFQKGSTNAQLADKALREEIEKIAPSLDTTNKAFIAASGEVTDYVNKVLTSQQKLAAANTLLFEFQKELLKIKVDGQTDFDKVTAGAAKVSSVLNAIRTGNFSLAKILYDGDAGAAQIQSRLDKISKKIELVNKFKNKTLEDAAKQGTLADVIGLGKSAKNESLTNTSTNTGESDLQKRLKLELETLKSVLDATDKYAPEYLQIQKDIANKTLEIDTLQAKRQIQSAKELSASLLAIRQKYQLDLTNIIARVDNRGLSNVSQSISPVSLDNIKISAETVKKVVDKAYEDAAAQTKESAEEINKANNSISNSLANIAGRFTSTFVDRILSGQKAIDVLKQSVKGLIVQLSALIVKWVAFAAIKKAVGIAASVVPGGGFVGTGLRFLSGFIGGRGVAAGGGLPGIRQTELSGAAVLTTTLKGSDIEIALNRTIRSGGRVG